MKRFGLAIVILVLGGISLFAQGTSQIQGVVKDTTGAVIGGVEVKTTQTETGIVRTVVTTEDGVYVLPNLPIGPYRIEVSKSGFSTYVQSGIVLQVATPQTIDISLKVGEIAQQVQVEANASLVELQSTSVGTVIENARIQGGNELAHRTKRAALCGNRQRSREVGHERFSWRPF